MKVLTYDEVPKSFLANNAYRRLLIEPELIRRAIFIEVHSGLVPAVPVGKFRVSGEFDVDFAGFQEIVDILKDRPGFPDVRSRRLSVEWGEKLPPSNEIEGDHRVYYGRKYGYREEKIQDFVGRVPCPVGIWRERQDERIAAGRAMKKTIHEALKDRSRSSEAYKEWVLFVAENDPKAAEAIDAALKRARERAEATEKNDNSWSGDQYS